jgi:hypothetical protein
MSQYYAYAVIERTGDGKVLKPLYDGPSLTTAKIIAEDFWEQSGKQVVVKGLGSGVSYFRAARDPHRTPDG